MILPHHVTPPPPLLPQVVDEYNRREQEIKNLEKELDEKSNALKTYRQNISEVL